MYLVTKRWSISRIFGMLSKDSVGHWFREIGFVGEKYKKQVIPKKKKNKATIMGEKNIESSWEIQLSAFEKKKNIPEKQKQRRKSSILMNVENLKIYYWKYNNKWEKYNVEEKHKHSSRNTSSNN